MDRRVFTLEAVNALVPRLTSVVARQLELRKKLDALFVDLGRELGDVPENIVIDPSDAPEVRALKRKLAKAIASYRAGWRELEQLGATVKDPRIGLLDFYGEVDGKRVWLCWKFGETECGFFHALEEGFAERRPIRTSMKNRLLN